ncbi:MAG TPA: hypothetical protein VN892_06095 [Solirubrobacteraceae bacterium]|nr:hypothetical protein [Solirubrobacteraceae bacterium]
MPKIAQGLARAVARPRRRPTRTSANGRTLAVLATLLAYAAIAPVGASAFETAFTKPFKTVTQIGSTVPANGDVNPYGIVDVATSSGKLVAGDILISNFNDAENKQGTGSTIVQLTPSGHQSLFAQITPASLGSETCPGGIGLTTALAILPQGYVVVGSLPTRNGKAATAKEGCLIVLNSAGVPVETISGSPIDGPWDLTAVSQGNDATLFVTNVLNGTVEAKGTPVDQGTVVRIKLHVTAKKPPKVTSETVIAEGFGEVTNPAALVIGPTGDTLGQEGTLFVADTLGNRIAAIPDALTRQTPLGEGGETVATGGFLNGPLGMTLAPNGDILTANANDGHIVETTPAGAEFQPAETGAGEGGLFGLTVAPNLKGVYFVNDAANTLELLH